MYRLIILLSLINVVVPHWDCSQHSCHKRIRQDYRIRHRDRTFDHLAKQVINLDKKTRELCTENFNNRTIEDYTSTDYKLTVNLPEYKEEDITVKLKYRALYINAEKEEDSELKVYFEVRVVPMVADREKATWNFSDGKLEISFPYFEQTKEVKPCDFAIDEQERIVPKYAPNLDVRMKDTTLVDTSKAGTEDSDSENKVHDA